MNIVRRQKLLLPSRLRCFSGFSGLYLRFSPCMTGREGGHNRLYPLPSAQDKAKIFTDINL